MVNVEWLSIVEVNRDCRYLALSYVWAPVLVVPHL